MLAILVMGLAADSIAAVNVLVLTGNVGQAEFSVLEGFTSVDGEKVDYTQTNDKNLPGLGNADVLWIGQGEICENGYFFNAETENKIRNFVKSGGIVISIGQDSDDADPCEVGWITKPRLCGENFDSAGYPKEVFTMQRIFIAVSLIAMILAVDSTADVNVLVLAGNISQAEFPVLEKFSDVDGQKVTYERTNDRSLPGLEDADILWIGQGEICEGAYFLKAENENKIKSFVESGGIAISIGQDSDGGRPCEVGWLPEPVVGIERGGVDTFEVTDAPEVGDLFKKPNEVNTAHFDDAWSNPDGQYTMLATIANGQDVGIALLKHGKGWYIVTSLENENASDVAINTPIMENLIHYAVNLAQTTAVEYRGKLSISWGEVKSTY